MARSFFYELFSWERNHLKRSTALGFVPEKFPKMHLVGNRSRQCPKNFVGTWELTVRRLVTSSVCASSSSTSS